MENVAAPGRVLLAEPGRRADERAEARVLAAGQDHRAMAFRRDLVVARAVVYRIDRRQGSRVRRGRGPARVILLERGFYQA